MRLQSRLFWLFALVAHALLAGTWFLFMPGGFPPTHPRTLSNRLLPPLIIALCVYALISARRHRPAHTRAALLSLSTLWLTASLTCLLLFPTSSRYLTPPSLVIGLLLLLSTRSPSLLPSTLPRRTTYFLLLPLSLLTGLSFPWTQRAPTPDTHPLNLPPPTLSSPSTDPPRMLTLSPGVRLQPSDAQLTLSQGRLFLYLQPLLTFVSRSPDRCWIAFSPPTLRKGPPRHLTSFHHDDTGTTLTYQDDTTSTLFIPAPSSLAADNSQPATPPPPSITLESFTTLDHPIFSHLNTYTELLIAGHSHLSLEFSPCPHHLIDVTYQEYPTGLPARLAYVAQDRSFHIVEATSGEKGPYHDLCPPGTLPPNAPLTITFYDTPTLSAHGTRSAGSSPATHPSPPQLGTRNLELGTPPPPLTTNNSQLTTTPIPIARLTLTDFSPQLSTQLSPTAGWRLPANSIEFSLQSPGPKSAAALFLSLASTSPGRGYDSTGHSPGTYRNHLTLQLLPPP